MSEKHKTGGLSALTERQAHVTEWEVTNGLRRFLVWVWSFI